MRTDNPVSTPLPNRADLKALAQATCPCLSIFLPVHTTGTNRRPDYSRLHSAIRAAEDKLGALALSPEEVEAFLDPIRKIAESDVHQGNGETQALAIFRTPERIWHYRLPLPVPETTVLANRFYIKPLLKTRSEELDFYLLALSQKHTRLNHCTAATSEEVQLPPSFPTNLAEFNQHSQPDHRLENRSFAGQKGKSGPRAGMIVAFGTGTDNDSKDEYLHHFFKEIDKQLHAFARTNALPLVVAGVDYEIALYHEVSEYPALVDGGVQGAPDGLKGDELHARALEVLRRYNESLADKALAQYEKAGGDRISMVLSKVLRAAVDGRVLYLFLADGARRFGTFDEDTGDVWELRDAELSGEDLLNTAAVQTIAHGGEVFMLGREKVPGEADAAAMFRF